MGCHNLLHLKPSNSYYILILLILQANFRNLFYFVFLLNSLHSLIKDIDNLKYGNDLSMNRQSQIIRSHDTIYINTWIGQCGSKYLLKDCSMYSNYDMYKDIFEQLSIDIEDIDYSEVQ